MTITKIENGKEVTLSLDGWLDTNSAPQLQEQIDAITEETESMVIDMEKLQYISSAGLRQLVAIYKKMKGQLVICNVSEELMGIFRMTGLDKMLKFA